MALFEPLSELRHRFQHPPGTPCAKCKSQETRVWGIGTFLTAHIRPTCPLEAVEKLRRQECLMRAQCHAFQNQSFGGSTDGAQASQWPPTTISSIFLTLFRPQRTSFAQERASKMPKIWVFLPELKHLELHWTCTVNVTHLFTVQMTR